MTIQELRNALGKGYDYASSEANNEVKNLGYREYMRGKADGYLLAIQELDLMLEKVSA